MTWGVARFRPAPRVGRAAPGLGPRNPRGFEGDPPQWGFGEGGVPGNWGLGSTFGGTGGEARGAGGFLVKGGPSSGLGVARDRVRSPGTGP